MSAQSASGPEGRDSIDIAQTCMAIAGRSCLHGFRECLVRHVEVEVVVLGAVRVAGHFMVVVGAVDEVHGSRRLLPVEAIVHVAVGVGEPGEQHRERCEP